MRKNFMRLLEFFIVFLMVSCGGQPTGACVQGSGIGAHCGDGFTAATCSMMGNSTFYQGKTCKQLGFQ